MVHQTKGREWDRNTVKLIDGETATLAVGLDEDSGHDRRLYAACIRAMSSIVQLTDKDQLPTLE